MSTAHKHPRIAGNWMETDTSPNHLEIAPTEERGVLALKSTFNDDILTCTEKQLLNLAETVSSGRLRSITQQQYNQ